MNISIRPILPFCFEHKTNPNLGINYHLLIEMRLLIMHDPQLFQKKKIQNSKWKAIPGPNWSAVSKEQTNLQSPCPHYPEYMQRRL